LEMQDSEMILYPAEQNAPINQRRVYLDQSVYGRMLSTGNWRESPIGTVLLEAQAAGRAQVWAGPTNVIEAIQAPNPITRKDLASMMLDLIEARRMWWGYEFEAVADFLRFVEQVAPEGIRHHEYFDDRCVTAQQTWLGALALLASTNGEHLGPLAKSLQHTKALNRLLHARFALAPDEWVDRMAFAAERFDTTDTDRFTYLEKLTIDEVEREIEELSAQAVKLDRATATKLDKRRRTVPKAYGAAEIGEMLQAIIHLPLELQLTFDVPHIISRWPDVQRTTGCESLPKDIVQTDERDKLADASIAHRVIEQLIRASGRKGLLTTYLGAEVIILEMQRCMNSEKIPTGGLTFDADHAAALVRHHVFVTHDELLLASLKTMSKRVEEQTEDQWKPEVVDTPKQLKRVLSRSI